MSEAAVIEDVKPWDTIKGSITTDTPVEGGKTFRLFRMSAITASGHKSMVVAVELDRLIEHPWLYKYTLDLLARDLGAWEPK